MAGKGGGAWKVAYADFVTAMMAFFLVMWITAQSKEVKESIANYFEDPMGSSETPRLTADAGAQGAASLGPIQSGGYHTRGIAESDPNSSSGPDGKQISAKRPPKLRVFEKKNASNTLGTMVLFAENGAELTEASKQQLETLCGGLKGKPNKIEIRGHSSPRPPAPGSPFRDSWDLCYARCVKTMEFMETCGVDRSRFRLSQDGAFEPYTRRRNAEWQELNSFVEVFATAEFSSSHKVDADAPSGYFGEFDWKSGKVNAPK